MATFVRNSWSRLGLLLAVVLLACGEDGEGGSPGAGGSAGAGGAGGAGGGSPEFVGAVCKATSDCFSGLASPVKGEVQCLDRVRGGYCTHTCETDADCCAVEGECKTTLRQVCSPFESTGQKMCFLSCEDEDLKASGESTDEQVFCQQQASTDFTCRSSGGGKENRKICVPGTCGVGAGCAADTDCSADLRCITTLRGGYCGVRDCKDNAGCPGDARCVKQADGAAICMKSCGADSECSFCRASGFSASCTDQVTFLEAGTTGKVCVPTP
ncbi:MAG: hypothetical protein MUF64_02420 [Polyangiaceae bacterium]|jgi:hypothetical protein|nr:hypothetical protein [Polyangiaceae bacterium]